MKKIFLVLLTALFLSGCMTRTERRVGLDGKDKMRRLRRSGFLGLWGEYHPVGRWENAPTQRRR